MEKLKGFVHQGAKGTGLLFGSLITAAKKHTVRMQPQLKGQCGDGIGVVHGETEEVDNTGVRLRLEER
jgi:hypothetical protein